MQTLHPALRNLKAVIFDVGGTLVHPDWRRLRSLVEAETAMLFTSAQLHEAFYAMLQVVDSGGQAALLAPTEVLAQQHHRSITAMLGAW